MRETRDEMRDLLRPLRFFFNLEGLFRAKSQEPRKKKRDTRNEKRENENKACPEVILGAKNQK
jgi:hypothetical protein